MKNFRIKIGLILCVIILTQMVNAQIFFEDKATELGIDALGSSSTILGGVSFYDYDKDGWDDITIASKGNQPVRFFKNFSGTFVEQTFNIIISGHSKQVLWVDYDNDNDNDLFVTKFDGSNRLYQNDGSFNFTDVTTVSGFPNSSILYTYGASFGDYNNDGFLDLFICNKDDGLVIPNQLYRNNGDGTFVDVSSIAGISETGHQSFCSVFFDYDKDGFQDIYISNDRVANTNILYHNNGDGTFTDVSIASGSNIGANAMSTTIADYNYDGWLDIYITNTSEGNYLLQNNGDGTFTNVAGASGTIFNSIGWGANFFDADNDTDLDLYVSSMINNPDSGILMSAFYQCETGYTYQIPNNAGFANDIYMSFANAIGDIDNDGFTDFIVANQAPDNHTLWKNSSGTNNWLKVNLEGVQSNKNGIGSFIEVYANNQTMYRYTLCGEAFLGQNSATEIFGIGTASNIDYVKVKWLSGIEDILYNVTSNQIITVVEGSTLSVNEFENNEVKIYPNPSNGIISFYNIEREMNVKIYDFLGRIIKNSTIDTDKNTLDLSKQSKGVYILVLSNSTFVTTKRIVLN